MTESIFLPLVGQYENIGDIMLRRPLARWLRPAGTLHIYLGPAPKGYVAGLALHPQDKLYASFGDWYRAGMCAAIRGGAHYVFKPGEIQLSLPGMKEHVGMLPLLAAVRSRGGRVIRIGSGARNFAVIPRMLMAPSIGLSQLTLWRDEPTARYLGAGRVMPDLAFSEGDSDPEAVPVEARERLVVSMRGDRGAVPDNFVDVLRSYARAYGLRVCVVTQVARDAGMSKHLADKLGGELIDWDGNAHDRQEMRLREIYRSARLAISNRLHVLIAAYTHGVLPVALLTDDSDKIDRHFRAAGISNVSLPIKEVGVDRILDHIDSMARRGPEVSAQLSRVRAELNDVRGQLVHMLTSNSRELARA